MTNKLFSNLRGKFEIQKITRFSGSFAPQEQVPDGCQKQEVFLK